jgi:carbamoyl-phosphate synthase large subunit
VIESPLNLLVIAVGGNVSQGILKALSYCSIPHRVVGVDISAAQFGLYTVERGYVGPWSNDPAFVDWLIDLCKKESIHAILTGAEPVVRVLAENKAIIEAATGAVSCVSDLSIIDLGDDKLDTCVWLREHGFAYPAFAASEDWAGLEGLVEQHGYPLVAKPRIGGGSRGLFFVEEEADLLYAHRKKRYVVQAHIGSDASEYTVGCVLDRSGQVAGSIAMQRVLLGGTTYRAFLGDFPEVRKVASAIATALGAWGPCNIQLRVTEDGPVCFEINPRFSGTTPIRAHFGFNEVEAVLRHYVLGVPMPEMPAVTQGIALRYWNELYVDPAALATLAQQGVLERDTAPPSCIETYGLN